MHNINTWGCLLKKTFDYSPMTAECHQMLGTSTLKIFLVLIVHQWQKRHLPLQTTLRNYLKNFEGLSRQFVMLTLACGDPFEWILRPKNCHVQILKLFLFFLMNFKVDVNLLFGLAGIDRITCQTFIWITCSLQDIIWTQYKQHFERDIIYIWPLTWSINFTACWWTL